MVVGNITKENLELKFVPLDEKELIEIELDITALDTIEDLLQKINALNIEENKLYKITLIGQRNFEVNTYKLIKMVENKEIIKIKDKSKLGYDLQEIAKQTTLKGYFVKEILMRMQNETENKELLEKALEIGLETLWYKTKIGG